MNNTPRRTQFVPRRLASVLLFGLFIVAGASGQDYAKVIEIVQKLEENVKGMIAAEEKTRKAEYEELRTQLQALQEGKVSVAVKEPKHEKEQENASVNPKPLLERLQKGNQRFINVKLSPKDFIRQRSELAKGQHPYAAVLTCSDSRVPPELLFDESLGQLFIIRNAGNVVDSVALGSIEYAAEHLHVGLLIVLGHESCGAVKATVAGGEVPPNIGSLVWRIKPAVDLAKAVQSDEKGLMNACVSGNVRLQMAEALRQSPVLREMVEKGELHMAGAVYNLETGKVTFLPSKETSETTPHAVSAASAHADEKK